MADLLIGSCKVDGCGAAVEGDPAAVRQWLVWHVYDDHREWWIDALDTVGDADRPPYDERPDLSLIYPWPPVNPRLCCPPICNLPALHKGGHFGGSNHGGVIRVGD